MTNKEKFEYLTYQCAEMELLLTRFNIYSDWYLYLREKQLKAALYIKLVLFKISHKDLTKHDWKN